MIFSSRMPFDTLDVSLALMSFAWFLIVHDCFWLCIWPVDATDPRPVQRAMEMSLVRAHWPGLALGFSDGGESAVIDQEIPTRATEPTEHLDDFGLPSRGTRLHDLIREGLPFEFLDRIASLLQVKREVISTAICISSPTLARRAKAGRFNTVESDRLVALIAVFEEALSLFESDVAAATGWMSMPVRGLCSKRPLDMMRTRVKTKAFDLIGRLERGVLV